MRSHAQPRIHMQPGTDLTDWAVYAAYAAAQKERYSLVIGTHSCTCCHSLDRIQPGTDVAGEELIMQSSAAWLQIGFPMKLHEGKQPFCIMG